MSPDWSVSKGPEEIEKEKRTLRKWPFTIIIDDEAECTRCGNKVLNHEGYVLEVIYVDGDEEGAKGTFHHINCRKS